MIVASKHVYKSFSRSTTCTGVQCAAIVVKPTISIQIENFLQGFGAEIENSRGKQLVAVNNIYRSFSVQNFIYYKIIEYIYIFSRFVDLNFNNNYSSLWNFFNQFYLKNIL